MACGYGRCGVCLPTPASRAGRARWQRAATCCASSSLNAACIASFITTKYCSTTAFLICVLLKQHFSLQKLRAKRLSSLIVGLAPPRIANHAQGKSQACDLEDDDHEDSQALKEAQQQQQQQQAQAGGKPQHASSATVQRFTGSQAAAAGRMPFATLSAKAAACVAGPTGQDSFPLAACGRATQAQQADPTQQHGTGAAADCVGPAALHEQGVVAADSLNDGQTAAVRRCAWPACDKISKQPCADIHEQGQEHRRSS